MKTVNEILLAKANKLLSISPDASVLDALKLMAEREVGALVVLEGEKLAGIFSERDYARKVILQGKASKDTAVAEIMSTARIWKRLRARTTFPLIKSSSCIARRSTACRCSDLLRASLTSPGSIRGLPRRGDQIRAHACLPAA